MTIEIPVSRIMTKKDKVITVTIPGSRNVLLDLIRRYGYSTYPVLKKDTNELVGVISRSDLFKNPTETQLSLLMIRDPVTVKPSDTVLKAAKILTENVFQRIPVVDEKEGKYLEGIIGRSDIVSKIVVTKKIESDVEKYCNKNVTAIWYKTPLPVAAMILRLSHQKGLPVIDTANMVGFITQQDFLKVAEVLDSQTTSRIASGAENDISSWDSESILVIGSKTLTLPNNLTVSDIMEKNIETCYKGATITEVAKKMRSKSIDQLPVVAADGSIIGMINQKLVIRAFLDYIEANEG